MYFLADIITPEYVIEHYCGGGGTFKCEVYNSGSGLTMFNNSNATANTIDIFYSHAWRISSTIGAGASVRWLVW
jgi:hypothetical protein